MKLISNKKHSIFILLALCFGLLITVVLFEFMSRNIIALPSAKQVNFHHIVRFIEGSDPKNRSPFLQPGPGYRPNQTIQYRTVYESPEDSKVLWDYSYTTNDLGFVQTHSVPLGRDAFLVIGDSFTEGTGAVPWFNKISPKINGLHMINASFFGTGFTDWLTKIKFLHSKFTLKKILIVFISDDFRRGAFTWPQDALECLHDQSKCDPQMPYFPMQLKAEAKSIVNARTADAKKSSFKRFVRSTLPYSSYLIASMLDLNRYKDEETENYGAIQEIIQLLGANSVKFLHIQMQEEINNYTPRGRRAQAAIQKAGGTLLIGTELCPMDAGDFHPQEGHPNQAGHEKLVLCLKKVIKGWN